MTSMTHCCSINPASPPRMKLAKKMEDLITRSLHQLAPVNRIAYRPVTELESNLDWRIDLVPTTAFDDGPKTWIRTVENRSIELNELDRAPLMIGYTLDDMKTAFTRVFMRNGDAKVLSVGDGDVLIEIEMTRGALEDAIFRTLHSEF